MMTSIENNIIICLIIGSISPLQTTSTTIEIAQLVGRNVSLNCPNRSTDNIIWKFNKSNVDTYFYDGKEFRGDQFKDRSRFENDSATGKEFLKISYIKSGDAGLYRCLDASHPDKPLQSTQLTVLGSEPSCYSTIHDDGFVGPTTCPLSQDDMRLSCAVSYHGTKAPRLQWETVNGNQIHKDLNCEEKANRTTQWINCTLTLKAEPQYDGSAFRCKVFTSHGEQYNCSTKAIKVLYFAPEERALEPTHKAKGDEISCSADNSSLKLNFCWMRKENNKEEVVCRNRSYVVVKEGLYYCNVSYSIKDTSCSAVVSVVYTSHQTENCKTVTILAIFLAIAMAVVIIFIIVYCIITSRRKATSIEAIVSDVILTNGWDTVKYDILSELKSEGALGESDYNKILGKKDGGIHMLVAAICSGGENACNIFKRVMKDILKIDLDDAPCNCGKRWYPHDFGGKPKAPCNCEESDSHDFGGETKASNANGNGGRGAYIALGTDGETKAEAV